MSALSDRIHIQMTMGFIQDNPSSIALTRMKKVTTGAGGFKLVADSVLAPQLGRLVDKSSSKENVSRTLSDGRILFPTGTIIFPLATDVEVYDKGPIDGNAHEVIFVDYGPWAIRAEVVRHAS